jgi:O-antigen/teichoic acid export membrane protein
MIQDIKRLVAQTSIYGIGNSLGKLSGVILMPLIVMHLPASDYGLLGLFESISLFLVAFSGLGLRAALSRWYWLPEKATQQKELFFTVTLASLILGVLLSAMALFFVQSFSQTIFRTELPTSMILVFMGSVFFKMLLEIPMLILRINQKAIQQTSYQTIYLFLSVAFTIYYLKYTDTGLTGVLMAQLLAAMLSFMILIPVLIKYSTPRFLSADFKAMIRFGLPLAMSNLMSILFSLSDRFILNYYDNLEVVGNFSLASKVSNVLQLIVITSFLSAYTHLFYQGMNKKGNLRFFSKAPTYFVLATTFCALILTLFGKEVIVVFSAANPEYWASIDVLPLLVAGLLFGGIRQLFVLDLSYYQKTKIISYSIVVSGVVNILLNFLLIPALSSHGAALATALTQIWIAAYLYHHVKRFSSNTYEIRKMTLAILIAGILSVVAIQLNSVDLWVRLPVKLSLLILYMLLLWLFRFFDSDESTAILYFWKKWRNPARLSQNIKQIKNEGTFKS